MTAVPMAERTAAQTVARTAAPAATGRRTVAQARVMTAVPMVVPTAAPDPTVARTAVRGRRRRRRRGRRSELLTVIDLEGRRADLRGRPALGRLLAIPSSRFADQFWATAPLLTRGEELRSGFDDLFSLEAADEILSTRGLRTPFIRVAKDGAIIDTSRFTGPGGVGASVGDQVIDNRIMELFASGHTIVLQALHRFWPPLIEFAGALSADLAHPVQINAYITPKQSQGFSAHYDVHDVFVLQIAGSKRWVIHDPVHPDPLPNQPWTRYRSAVESCAAEDPSADHVLEEGDVLYLPRGFIHSAEALGGVSIHLTIGIHSHTRHDLVRSLLELAEEDPRLRRSLPLGSTSAIPPSWAPTSPPPWPHSRSRSRRYPRPRLRR